MPLREHTVLLVEDDVYLGADVRQALMELNAKVVGPARSVAEAMAMLEDQHCCTVALVDMKLGTETALPIIRKLQERGVPFVLMTAYDRADLDADFRDAPLLSKPFGYDELGRWMRSVVSNPHDLPKE